MEMDKMIQQSKYGKEKVNQIELSTKHKEFFVLLFEELFFSNFDLQIYSTAESIPAKYVFIQNKALSYR